jgi:hypothetical protein
MSQSFPPIHTLYSPEVLKALEVALSEVGSIQPKRDTETNAWVFVSSLYPTVECEGSTRKDCIERYPYWLAEFIQFRLKGRITPQDERATSGRGGKRLGAGRPKSAVACATSRQIRLRPEVAEFLREHKDLHPWLANPKNQKRLVDLFKADDRIRG